MKKLVVSESPHLRAKLNDNRIYLILIAVLMLPAISGVYFFGLNSLYIIAVSVCSAILIDAGLQKLEKKEKIEYINPSAIITGLLLALILPPTVPLWIPIIGVIVSIGLGKHAFGKHGAIFNPALIGRAFLAVSFPVLMTTWMWKDASTAATPLAQVKFSGLDSLIQYSGSKILMYKSLFIGNVAGSIGETSALLLIIAGIILLAAKVIEWRIPLSYILSMVVFAFVFKQDILFSLLAGGFLLGCFFMATDYVTTPITKNGRLIFGFGCGFLTIILRVYSGMPEGVCFAILLMNALTPFIDRITTTTPFGRSKKVRFISE